MENTGPFRGHGLLYAVTLTVFLAAINTRAENNSNYVFNGPTQTTNFGGALYIPMTGTGTNNSLQILNGGAVTNAGGVIGLNGGDNFNYAIVSDPGSIWHNSGDYSIGSGGSNNRLIITNQGVANINGYAYVGSTGSTNNFVIVTDPGSVWNIGLRLHPGYAGTQAGLIITNGGTVKAQQTWVGGFTSSSNHTVVVTGAGSLYSNSLDFSMGVYAGSGGNRVTVSAGGLLVSGSGAVGSDSTGGNNLVTVTGGGSVWSNTGVLYVGVNGSNNQLIITNGARVYNVHSAIGANPGANNNSVVVTGSGSRWDSPGNLSVGSQGNNNRLTISAGGIVTSTDGYVGSTGSTNNQLYVDGTGSAWNITSGFYAGYAGAGSRIVITNGGAVTAAFTALGQFANSSNTSITVTGPGSILANTGALNIGPNLNTGGNTLTITDGGRVVNSSATIGGVASSPNNIITVAGSGSVWSNTLGVVLGDNSSGNDLKVTDGGSMYVGNSLSVGSLGSNNRMIITNGGTVNVAQYAYVGSTGTTNNQVVVSDSGSVWNVGLRLHPGYAGTRASLIVTNGGTVNAQQTWVGGFTSASSNTVLVTGAGSLISNSLDFSIGVYPGSGGNQVTVAQGGRVISATAAVGGDANGGGNNLLTITDSGSVWSNTSSFYLGAGGSTDNQLLVRNGGTLRSDADINVGYFGRNNQAMVTDPGSLMSAGSIAVGTYGRNNTLVITNGGRAVTPNMYVGNGTPGAIGSNSLVIVTGAGSLISNSVATYIGHNGPSNTLLISNGGRVYSTDAYLGYYHTPAIDWLGDNNLAVVTGAGSTWTVAGTLRVGLNGITNTVLITDGGTLEANTLVTGGGTVSTITNRGGVYQFTSASPTITPSSGAGSIMMSNATVSYRGVVGADINNAQVGNISKQGNNGFQLNNSTNTSVASYTLNTGNPSNYYRLALVNGGSRWQSTATTIGSDGQLLVSNSSAASVAGTVSNAGTISVVNSKVTFEGTVTISGSYRSDPSTNTFLSDVTVSPDGVVYGGHGDLFDFRKSFYIHSTNNTGFQIGRSAVMFSGGGMHTNAITGQDFSTNAVGFTDNFAYGELHLGSSSDQICFECGNLPVPTNGLYVGWLDLLGDASLVTNLHAANGINIYYDKTDVRNAYLGALTYGLTDCNFVTGGGSLIPVIPEPTTLVMLGVATVLLLRRRP